MKLLLQTLLSISILLELPIWASTENVEPLHTVTRVCPFTVIGGPKALGNVIVALYTNTTCNIAGYIGNYSWGGRGATPTLTNGTHALSNEALSNVGLLAFPATQAIELQVYNPAGTPAGTPEHPLPCMAATVISNVLTCSGAPGTLDISPL